MTNFDQIPFVSINDEVISLATTLQYLQLSGRLIPFLQDIVSQHITYEEVKKRDETLTVGQGDMDQAVIDFRLNNNLNDTDAFQAWLSSQGMSYEGFQRRVVLALKVDRLKEQIAEPDLESYFQDNQTALGQAELSCAICNDPAIALTLHQKLQNQETTFDQISKDYANDPETVSLMRGLIRLTQLPADLQSAVGSAEPGKLVGPRPVGQRSAIFLVERFVPAELEGKLKKELQERLFRKWLGTQIKDMQVKLLQDSA
jgi:hypothetical protein